MVSLTQALERRRSCRDFANRPVQPAALRRIVAALKGGRDPDGKRAVFSAHALYPLRFRFVAGAVEGLPAGVYDADGPDDGGFRLEREGDVRRQLEAAALDVQPWLGTAPAIVAICADLGAASNGFAEQPPYGMRGLRYAHMEAGAAAFAVQLLAEGEGLGSVLVGGFRDEATGDALGLPPPIAPLALMCIGWPQGGDGGRAR